MTCPSPPLSCVSPCEAGRSPGPLFFVLGVTDSTDGVGSRCCTVRVGLEQRGGDSVVSVFATDTTSSPSPTPAASMRAWVYGLTGLDYIYIYIYIYISFRPASLLI